jgi:hypothetical protein
MIATRHGKSDPAPDTDNLIVVSSDTHIGPLAAQLRSYCPQKYIDQFGIRVYALDVEQLQKVADRISAPAVAEVATPLEAHEVPVEHGLFSFRTIGAWA